MLRSRNTRRTRTSCFLLSLTCSLTVALAACSSSSTKNPGGSGGASNQGGSSTASGGSGGAGNSGGSNGSGGAAGSNGSGGSKGSGGAAGAAGAQGGAGSGGAAGSNGSGSSNPGGSSGSGGATSGAGGSTVTCTGSQTACENTCADLQTDAKNCGTCGTNCPSGTCNAGVCKKVKDCYVKTVMTSPLLADFEGYDGKTATTKWGWAINAPAGDSKAVYAGLYEYDDGTGSPALAIAGPGNKDSKYAATMATTSPASKWGGAFGMWMSCVDASLYQGVSFWVKGTLPIDTATMNLVEEATSAPDKTDANGGGTCTTGTCTAASVTFPVSTTWSQVLVKWDAFTPGTANGATVPVLGKDLTGITWSANLKWTAAGDGGYSPVPGQYSLSIDDVQLIGTAACSGSLQVCGIGCVDTATDGENCGKCDNACTGAHTCTGGSCVCPTGYTECNGDCVNTQIDAQNCGGCEKACSGACSAGSCQTSSCTASMPQKDKNSTAGSSIVLGKYWINNNQWGISGATGTQNIWDTCSSGNTIGWGTDWTWSGGSASQVKSYASAVLGWQWGWKVTNTGLPVQFSASKNITCGWTYRVQPGDVMNVSYDLFAHTQSNPGTNDDPSDEIMIWLYKVAAAPIGSTAATVSIGGSGWELHEGSNGRWNVHSYVRTSNAATGATLNMMDFINDLTTNRGLAKTKYLTSIQAGTEVTAGTGSLNVDQYYCTIQ